MHREHAPARLRLLPGKESLFRSAGHDAPRDRAGARSRRESAVMELMAQDAGSGGDGEFPEGRIDCPGSTVGVLKRPAGQGEGSRRAVTFCTGGQSSPPERNARAVPSSLIDGMGFRGPRRRSPRIRGGPRRRRLRHSWRSGRSRRLGRISDLDRSFPGPRVCPSRLARLCQVGDPIPAPFRWDSGRSFRTPAHRAPSARTSGTGIPAMSPVPPMALPGVASRSPQSRFPAVPARQAVPDSDVLPVPAHARRRDPGGKAVRLSQLDSLGSGGEQGAEARGTGPVAADGERLTIRSGGGEHP